jgi:MFS family permease
VSTQVLTIASAVPAASSMILVFMAGMLSTRLDWFTLVRWSAALTAVAWLVAAAAPSLAILTVGRAVAAMGVSASMVAGLGILQQSFADEGARARVFGSLPPLHRSSSSWRRPSSDF